MNARFPVCGCAFAANSRLQDEMDQQQAGRCTSVDATLRKVGEGWGTRP